MTESDCSLIERLGFSEENGHGFGNQLPPVICLLAAMTNRDIPGDPCVLLPIKDRVAAFTAIVTAFQAAKLRFPELLASYIESFEVGDRIRILPSGHVYLFDGQIECEGQHFFMLRFLNEPSAKRSFPLDEAVRLEKTTLTNPLGRGERLNEFQISNLDLVLDVKSGGNTALFRNEVVLVSTISSFKNFVNNIYVSMPQSPGKGFLLSDILPWGTVNSDGTLDFRNSAVASGDPLIAVAPRPEYAAIFCQKSEIQNSRVIVDGSRWVGESLQALDDIIDYGKLLLVTDHSELDLLPTMEGRGCTVWKLPRKQDRLVGIRDRVMHSFATSCPRSDQFKLKITSCTSQPIDDAAESLLEAASLLNEQEDNDVLQNLVSRGFSCLLSVSSILHNMDAEDAEKKNIKSILEGLGQKLKTDTVWLPEKTCQAITDAIASIEAFVESDGTLEQNSKQRALLDLLNQGSTHGAKPTILASHETAADSVRRFLKGRIEQEVPVTTFQAFLARPNSESVIITGWPLTRRMGRFAYAYLVDSIHVLAYCFEKTWFLNFENRRARDLAKWDASAERLQELSGMSFPELTEKGFSIQQEPSPPKYDEGVLMDRIEIRLNSLRKGAPAKNVTEPRNARYVSFLGSTYAYLTETHRVPNVTDIVRGRASDRFGVSMVGIDDLAPGNLVLFRVHQDADPDIIRHLAETLDREYSQVREIAEEWKAALESISDSLRGIATKLAQVGLIRTTQAIRSWIHDPNRIGPMTEEDLQKISIASGNIEFQRKVPEIWKAISIIRGAHIQAGNKLNQILLELLPGQVPEISDTETVVELSSKEIALGKVAIVEVDQIDDEPEQRSYHEVNRLLWDQMKYESIQLL